MKSKSKLILFIDGSADTREKIGYGAYLIIQEQELLAKPLNVKVKVKRFENTSSTKLELQTLLWALDDIQATDRRIIVYTDSQNIISLPDRRSRLEQNDYLSRNNKHLKNHELYRGFYRKTDQLECEFRKVRGHLPASKKDHIARLFTLVDRISRKMLRKNDNQAVEQALNYYFDGNWSETA